MLFSGERATQYVLTLAAALYLIDAVDAVRLNGSVRGALHAPVR